MQIAQHRPVITSRQDQPSLHWQTEAGNARATTNLPNRVYEPLTFSIDDRLSEQPLTRLDLCSKHLKKIEKLPPNINFNIVLLDNNDIAKVEHLDALTHLVELSISNNRLVDIRVIGRLKSLQKLNLAHNSLDSIDCLKNLPNLVMLNISNNNIQNINALNTCPSLQSLDASDNAIQCIEDLSHLTSLKYLNLHKNLINSLIPALKFWPKSIHTLIISDNEIRDLTEISCLSSLLDLNTLFIHNNPCLFVIDDRHGYHQPFDYRPYVLNWCLTIHNLDGIFITRKESLKSEWLLSQGKGRSFRSGEHNELVQYLIKVCGTDADERDDLHLSRIMVQQDLYKQNFDDNILRSSNVVKDSKDPQSKDNQPKAQQSLLVSESEFMKVSSSSSNSTCNEQPMSDHQKISISNQDKQMHTPSPKSVETTNQHDEQVSECHSHTRYNEYDNRPIKPLDKNMLQSRLSQYPIENHIDDDNNHSRARNSTNSQQQKRASTHLAYSANRYSPKTTSRGPTASTTVNVNMRAKTSKNLPTQQQNQAKRHTIAAVNTNTFNLLNPTNRTTSARTVKQNQKSTLNENNGLSDDEEEELHLKSAPINRTSTIQNTVNNEHNSVDFKKLTTSVETMRTSFLQAYLDLHERFAKASELHTSALAALWKMFETENQTHRLQADKMIEENRLLAKRLQELESRLAIKSDRLHPPLRAHISKRDTKSFFLYWVPNPLNERCTVLGYRIYIDDILKGCVDAEKFEAIIDCIRDEGEYKIKLRAFNDHDESSDSNIVVARFRRQHSTTVMTDSNQAESKPIYRTQSDLTTDTNSQTQLTEIPLRQTQSHDNFEHSTADEIHMPSVTKTPTTPEKVTPEKTTSSTTSSPSRSNRANSIENKSSRKSLDSSPHHNDKLEVLPTMSDAFARALFMNNSTDTSAAVAKSDVTPTGVMARLSKSPHRIKRNNVLLNALSMYQSSNSTDQTDSHPPENQLNEQATTLLESNVTTNHNHYQIQSNSNAPDSTTISSSPSLIHS